MFFIQTGELTAQRGEVRPVLPWDPAFVHSGASREQSEGKLTFLPLQGTEERSPDAGTKELTILIVQYDPDTVPGSRLTSSRRQYWRVVQDRPGVKSIVVCMA